MSYTIRARMKKAGKQKKESLIPVPFELPKRPDTVRELLTALTELSVKEYNERKDQGQLLPYLTKGEILDQASEGKVSFGVHQGSDADPQKAVDNAIQCFEDGIYRVFYGEEELTGLEEPIPWEPAEEKAESGAAAEDGKEASGSAACVFTFIRLTMLSGW